MIGGLSPEARALLRAARSDSPPAATRAAIWNGVQPPAVPVPMTAPPLPAAAAAAPAVTLKAAFIGGALGSVLSAGITLALLSPMHPRAAEPAFTASPVSSPVVAPPLVLVAPVRASAPGSGEVAAAPAIAIALSKPTIVAPKARTVPAGDSLSREVALVAEARGELLRGDATRALSTIRVARSLKVRQLEPEELSVEIRALRALNRTDEADRVDAKLRADFPEHALAR
jgi:hypothetical protein